MLALCLLLIVHLVQSARDVYQKERRPFANALGSTTNIPPWHFRWRCYVVVALYLAVPISLASIVLKKSPALFTSPSFVVDPNTNVTLPDLRVLNGLPSVPNDKDDHPPSLIDLFTQDFPELIRAENNLTMNGIDLPLKQQVYLDFQGRSKFVGFYVPQKNPITDGHSAVIICKAFPGQVQPMLNAIEKNTPITGGLGMENAVPIPELTFTKTALIYHESILTTLEKAAIIEAFRDKGLDVQFRGPDYEASRTSSWFNNHKKQ
jgi:hypothetical protein